MIAFAGSDKKLAIDASLCKMPMKPEPKLSRREREIMELVYAAEELSAEEIREQLIDPPANAAVRNHLRILEEKGHLARRKSGRKYLYRAKASRLKTGRSAIGRVIDVYFGASLQKAVAAHMANPKATVSEEELEALEDLIRETRQNQATESKSKKRRKR